MIWLDVLTINNDPNVVLCLYLLAVLEILVCCACLVDPVYVCY